MLPLWFGGSHPLIQRFSSTCDLFLRRGEACLRPRRLGDHQERPYTGRTKLQTARGVGFSSNPQVSRACHSPPDTLARHVRAGGHPSFLPTTLSLFPDSRLRGNDAWSSHTVKNLPLKGSHPSPHTGAKHGFALQSASMAGALQNYGVTSLLPIGFSRHVWECSLP
jgi:hypothetical protein